MTKRKIYNPVENDLLGLALDSYSFLLRFYFLILFREAFIEATQRDARQFEADLVLLLAEYCLSGGTYVNVT